MQSIVLCSTSARRKELMGWLGVPFIVKASSFDESCISPDSNDPEGYVTTLALGKTLQVSAHQDCPQDAILIGADTIVFHDGVFYGKPRTLDDARTTLKVLFGSTHQVYTSICMLHTLTGEKRVEIVESTVVFSPVADADLEKYLATGESMGKAGSYGIQGAASSFVQEVRGSMTNIIGFPLLTVRDMLEEMGIVIDVDVEKSIYRKTGYRS